MIRFAIVMGILAGIFALFGCKPSDSTGIVANQIKIDGLTSELRKLKEGKTEFDFFGITSDGVDCVYFVKDGNHFQIEFEAIYEKQVPYIEKLNEFANSNGFKGSMITYGNKPKYVGPKEAPVIRIETNSNLDETAKIGEDIQRSVFLNNEQTIYDVVP